MKFYVVKILSHREWNPAMLVRMPDRLLSAYLDVLHGRQQMRGRLGHGEIKQSSVAEATPEEIENFDGHYVFDGNQLKWHHHAGM